MKIDASTVLTKADLEMAVFLSRGEVDRYRLILEHDIRAFELMNPDPIVMEADTVILARQGLLDGDHSLGLKHLAQGYVFPEELKMKTTWEFFPNAVAQIPADDAEERDDVIRSVGGAQDDTDETGTLYRAPVV